MQGPLNVKKSLRLFKLGNLFKNQIAYYKVSIRLMQPQETKPVLIFTVKPLYINLNLSCINPVHIFHGIS